MQRPFRRPVRFRNRRQAERVLAEIVEEGGRRSEFRIDQAADGTCLITILETEGSDRVVGTLGA